MYLYMYMIYQAFHLIFPRQLHSMILLRYSLPILQLLEDEFVQFCPRKRQEINHFRDATEKLVPLEVTFEDGLDDAVFECTRDGDLLLHFLFNVVITQTLIGGRFADLSRGKLEKFVYCIVCAWRLASVNMCKCEHINMYK